MKFDELLDNYPAPFFVIKPIYGENGGMIDFRYEFINDAFARFLGKTKNELLHNTFVSVFGNNYDKDWMLFFDRVVKNKTFLSETRFTGVISRTVVIESFCIKPDLCASFIRDYFATNNGDSANNRVNTDVLRKAYYDYMTNFYNINYLNEHKNLIVNSKNIGLVYLDINNLKKTNNEEGHRAGDRLILKFTNFIRNNFSGNDFFRLGGDEFLVIVMGLNEKQFEELCLDVKAELDSSDLASIGYSFYENISDVSECIKDVGLKMEIHKKEMRKRNAKK